MFWGSISHNSFVLDTCFEKPHIFSAHSVDLLNNLTLKERWAIILIKGKLEIREAYTSVAFRETRMYSLLYFYAGIWFCHFETVRIIFSQLIQLENMSLLNFSLNLRMMLSFYQQTLGCVLCLLFVSPNSNKLYWWHINSIAMFTY